jgi:thiamine-phosphate pyrophosphorylase
MDQRLLAWGLRPPSLGTPVILPGFAKQHTGSRHNPLPRLWLFTDERRLPDPRPSVAVLPRGRAGVIFRHDGDPARAAIARDLARICRDRRLLLVVAGDARLAASVKAGSHLRGGRWSDSFHPTGLRTSSAHSIPELRRARAAGAALVFLSPAFPTDSHVGAAGLGPLRWSAMARSFRAGLEAPVTGVAALGGVDGQTVRALPARFLRAVGAIGALLRG